MFHTLALFLLRESDKYGIDRSAMSSMVNLRNGQNKNPIDIAKELATSYQDGLDGFELLKRLYRDLIEELEKCTSCNV